MLSGLVFLLDLLLSLSLATLVTTTASLEKIFTASVFIIAVLAPFLFYNKHLGAIASRGKTYELFRSHCLRLVLLTGIVLTLYSVSNSYRQLPVTELLTAWVAVYLAGIGIITSLIRVLVAMYVQNLQRSGVLTEVIAVIGAGPEADRLIHTLRQNRTESFELLGVFDDKIINAKPSTHKSVGTVEHLIELGKTHKIDWILLALPPSAEQRILSIVQRLKALSVPIGFCPQHVGSSVPYHTIDHVGQSIPVNLLTDRSHSQWKMTVIKTAESILPRWVITLALLPWITVQALWQVLWQGWWNKRAQKLTLRIDNYDMAKFTEAAANFGQDRYGYVVTPNADHIIRWHENVSFREYYATANYTLLDSRFLAYMLRAIDGIQLPVCTGSDLTANLFNNVIRPDDSLVLIGGSDTQAQQLCQIYGLRHLAHYNPPMGFYRDPEMMETCLQFIEAHSPFRFCFLAVGSPQQEALAHQLKMRGMARGLSLCIGASINFITGDERRAPMWMQYSGMEWLFRLLQAPKRMTRRYLVRGPRVFKLLFMQTDILLRQVSIPRPRVTIEPNPPTDPLTGLTVRTIEPKYDHAEGSHFQSDKQISKTGTY